MNEYFKYEDSELLVLLKEDKPVCEFAFEVLWHRYSNNLKQYCFLKTGNKEEAEDLFQSVWMEFYKTTKSGIKIKSIKYYLFKISHLLYWKHIKINNLDFVSSSSFDLDKFIDDSMNFIEKFERQEILVHFYFALNYLDKESRDCLILKWIEELSYQEIAEIYHESYDAIRIRCSRAMDRIIKIVGSIIKEKN